MMQGQNFVWIVALPGFCEKTWFWPILPYCAEKFSEIQNSFFQSKALFLLYNILSEDFLKVENCVLVARKAKTPKNGANFVKKNFLPETQLQVISKQNPYTPDPLGGRGSWWTPPHISTPRTQFSYLVSFLPTCVLNSYQWKVWKCWKCCIVARLVKSAK